MDKTKESVIRKLDPRRFSNMSGKMAAIVGYFIGENFTEPSITSIVVTSDKFALAGKSNDIGNNEILGYIEEVERNMENLLEAVPDLTDEEKDWVRAQMKVKMVRYDRLAPSFG